MGERIAVAKILLIQYGPTMTLAEFQAHFMPSVMVKTIRNKVARGDLPRLHGEVFDSQEVGEWWESFRVAA